MKRLILLFSAFFFLFPTLCFSVESFDTVYIEGLAPITIDGDLGDWDGIFLENFNISNPVTKGILAPNGPEDISGTFRCFADSRYFYVAVDVKDDVVITGKTRPIWGWDDDSVVICFDGDRHNIDKNYLDENDGNIRVILDRVGNVQIQGDVPYIKISIPYFWEARGVQAGFKKGIGGYTVEAAIPFNVLGWSLPINNQEYGFNIHITDNDGNNNGLMEHCISWAIDPDNTNMKTTKNYNVMKFIQKIDVLGATSISATSSAVITGPRSVEIELNGSNISEQEILCRDITQKFKNEDWDGVLSLIEPFKGNVWTKPLQIIVQFQKLDMEKGITLINEFEKINHDIHVSSWTKEYTFTAGEYMYNVKYLYNFAAFLFLKNIEFGCNNPESYEFLPSSIEYTGINKQNINISGENIIDEIESNLSKIPDEYKESILLSIARYYFYVDNFSIARQKAENIISSSQNDKTKLEAEMILKSIELAK